MQSFRNFIPYPVQLMLPWAVFCLFDWAQQATTSSSHLACSYQFLYMPLGDTRDRHPNDQILIVDIGKNQIKILGHDYTERPNKLGQDTSLEEQDSSFIMLQTVKSNTKVWALITYRTPAFIWENSPLKSHQYFVVCKLIYQCCEASFAMRIHFFFFFFSLAEKK